MHLNREKGILTGSKVPLDRLSARIAKVCELSRPCLNEQGLDIDYTLVDPNVVSVSDPTVKINLMSNHLETYRDNVSFRLCGAGYYLTKRPCSNDVVELSC